MKLSDNLKLWFSPKLRTIFILIHRDTFEDIDDSIFESHDMTE